MEIAKEHHATKTLVKLHCWCGLLAGRVTRPSSRPSTWVHCGGQAPQTGLQESFGARPRQLNSKFTSMTSWWRRGAGPDGIEGDVETTWQRRGKNVGDLSRTHCPLVEGGWVQESLKFTGTDGVMQARELSHVSGVVQHNEKPAGTSTVSAMILEPFRVRRMYASEMRDIPVRSDKNI